ncbi:MAG: helix-turn-helix domain-containing protein [Acidobacteriia bacterium]|nr:helix-turn-helix domain-containing protein [Terriglobia bacterium]
MQHEPISVSRWEAARLLGISTRTVDYLLEKKELTPRRVGRKVLISYEELQAFARRDHASPARPNRSSSSPLPRGGDK